MSRKFSYINRCLNKGKMAARKILRTLKFQRQAPIPDIIVALSYSQFYTDFRHVKPEEFLKGIPSFTALKFVLDLENKVHYTLHDPKEDMKLITVFYNLSTPQVQNIIKSVIRKRGKNVTFINSEGTLRFVRLALKYFTPESTPNYQLTDAEVHNIIKAYLYCNQLWTNEQLNSSMARYKNLVDASLKVDLPFSEFKYFKDFRTQLFKAIKLFEFAETDNTFSPILTQFCADRNVADWREYIRILFGFFEPSLNASTIDMSTAPSQVKQFMQPYIATKADFPQDDNLKGQLPQCLRDKFLLQSSLNPNLILILSSDLLVDKFYQGLKFDFGKIAAKYGFLDSKNKPLSQKTINSMLGSEFSEETILYSILDIIYSTRKDVALYSGSTTKPIFKKLKGKENGSEPDYYWRQGKNLILFENKDVLFPESSKSSTSLVQQKTIVSSRIARFGKCLGNDKKLHEKKEGLGQIYFNIYRMIHNPEPYRSFDADFDSIETIYPVLITYDKTFSALGVNALIDKRVAGIKKRLAAWYRDYFSQDIKLRKYNIKKAVIIDIDTLIMYSLVLRNQDLDIVELLNEYIALAPSGTPNLSSFYSFIIDHHRLGAQGNEFIQTLYGGILQP